MSMARIGLATTSCSWTGKIRYGSEADADEELAWCQEQAACGNPRRREVATYVCTHCRGWHLTSQQLPGSSEVAA